VSAVGTETKSYLGKEQHMKTMTISVAFLVVLSVLGAIGDLRSESIGLEGARRNITKAKPHVTGTKGEAIESNMTYRYPCASASNMQDKTLGILWRITDEVGKTLTGDVNGDGLLEIVYVSSDVLNVLDGNGSKIWSKALPDGGNVNILDDVTGDGVAEIVLSTKVGNTLKLLFFDGAGSFLKEITESKGVRNDNNLNVRAIVDLDNDDDLEIVTVRNAGYDLRSRGVEVFDYNTGSRVWFNPIGPAVSTLCIEDITGDASKEIIAGTFGPYNGHSCNGFHDSRCYVMCWDKAGTLLWSRQFEGSGFVDSEVSIGDLDGDGSIEVVATSRSHGWNAWDGRLGRIYLLNPHDGSIHMERNVGKPVRVAGLADVLGNGTKEILVDYMDASTQQGKILLFDTSLNFIREHVVSGSRLQLCAVNDLNKDGRQELIVKRTERPDSANLIVLNEALHHLYEIDLPSSVDGCLVTDLGGTGGNELIVTTASHLYVLDGSVRPIVP